MDSYFKQDCTLDHEKGNPSFDLLLKMTYTSKIESDLPPQIHLKLGIESDLPPGNLIT